MTAQTKRFFIRTFLGRFALGLHAFELFFMESISCLFFSASSLTSIKERKTFNYLDIETLDRASYWKFQKNLRCNLRPF